MPDPRENEYAQTPTGVWGFAWAAFVVTLKQGPVLTVLLMILVAIGAGAWYGVPAHLKQIEEGYKDQSETFERVSKIQTDAWTTQHKLQTEAYKDQAQLNREMHRDNLKDVTESMGKATDGFMQALEEIKRRRGE